MVSKIINKNGIVKNIGCFIILSIIFFHIISLFIFYIKQLSDIKNKIKSIIFGVKNINLIKKNVTEELYNEINKKENKINPPIKSQIKVKKKKGNMKYK